MKHVLIILLVVARISVAADTGDVFRSSQSGHSYRLQEWLGQGFFGSVWKAEDVRTGERFALKFFVTRRLKAVTLKTYRRIASAQDQGKLTRTVRVHSPEVFTPVSSKAKHRLHGVRFELVHGNVESIAESSFQLSRATSRIDFVDRLLRAKQLLTEVIAGIAELHALGLNHHDLNPRNILFNSRNYVIGDLDEVRPHGERPTNYAFEDHCAPLEYFRSNFHFDDGNASDLHQLANTLYRLLFGKYWKSEIADREGFSSVADLRLTGLERSQIRYWDLALHKNLIDQFSLYGISSTAENLEIFSFLRDGMLLDYDLRGHFLANNPLTNGLNLDFLILPREEIEVRLGRSVWPVGWNCSSALVRAAY